MILLGNEEVDALLACFNREPPSTDEELALLYRAVNRLQDDRYARLKSRQGAILTGTIDDPS